MELNFPFESKSRTPNARWMLNINQSTKYSNLKILHYKQIFFYIESVENCFKKKKEKKER